MSDTNETDALAPLPDIAARTATAKLTSFLRKAQTSTGEPSSAATLKLQAENMRLKEELALAREDVKAFKADNERLKTRNTFLERTNDNLEQRVKTGDEIKAELFKVVQSLHEQVYGPLRTDKSSALASQDASAAEAHLAPASGATDLM